jgi:hypothetical protein
LVLNPAAPNAPVNGSLVFLNMPPVTNRGYMAPFSDRINLFHKKGAIGVISALRTYRIPGHQVYGSIGLNFYIPVGYVSRELYDYALSLGKTNITVQFYGYDPNPWAVVEDGPGYLAFTILICGLFFINSCLSGYRLAMWIYVKQRVDISLGFVCLSLEFLCNVIRTIGVILWGFHNNYYIPNVNVMFTIPWCLTSITLILIVFFWLDLTADPFYHGKFLGIMKIPAGVFIVLIIGLEIMNNSVRLSGVLEDGYTPVVIGIYSSVLGIITLFTFFAAFRILKPAQKNSQENKKKLVRITKRIVIAGIFTLCGVITFCVFYDTTTQYTPVGMCLTWTALYLFFGLQSLALIMIFSVPKQKDNTSSSLKETKEQSE